MTLKELDQLEELYRCTIPGPWDGVVSTGQVRYLGPPTKSLEHGDVVATCTTTAAALLIADMHRLLPEFLAFVRRHTTD
jgi:hypothetical protein